MKYGKSLEQSKSTSASKIPALKNLLFLEVFFLSLEMCKSESENNSVYIERVEHFVHIFMIIILSCIPQH